MGICHQVNLEYLAKVVTVRDGIIFPDTLIGTDSHTPMVNGIGVIGWGVGGIEAEAVMLGQPIYIILPEVVGKFVEVFGNGLKSVKIKVDESEYLISDGSLAKKAVEK